nr:hypothetical protein GCM10020093_065140 [Planobispora longispora]
MAAAGLNGRRGRSRDFSDQRLWSSTPTDTARRLRPGLAAVADQVIDEITLRIPEYARPADSVYIKVIKLAVDEALRQFVDRIENPSRPWEPDVFRTIGRGEANEGRNLEPLQTALRLGARVAWRRLTEQSETLGLTPQHLYDLGEAIFVYLDQLADAAAEGFDEARAHAAGEIERRRHRLMDLLLSQPPPLPTPSPTWPRPPAGGCPRPSPGWRWRITPAATARRRSRRTCSPASTGPTPA